MKALFETEANSEVRKPALFISLQATGEEKDLGSIAGREQLNG